MSRPHVLLAVLTFAGLALAGCIQPPGGDAEGASFNDPPSGTHEGRMSATEEQSEVTVKPCTEGGVGFCAERTVRVTGEVGGMPLLEVSLATVNGPVRIDGGAGDAWKLVATLRGSGTTPDDARRALERIEFAWSHESSEGHYLNAEARMEGRGDDRTGRYAKLELTMPRALALRLVASTTNGEVRASDVRTDGLSLSTTNGEVGAKASVTQVQMSTTNGKVHGELTPTGSGRITLSTTNGAIDLKVPEDSTLGYDLVGSTTNGEVDITLRDGDVGPCPQGSQYYTPPCNHRTFTTNNFGLRDIRTTVALSTTNGDVDVSPL